jgi:hypothetical protein
MIVSRNPNDKNYVKKVAVKVSMDDWENDWWNIPLSPLMS